MTQRTNRAGSQGAQMRQKARKGPCFSSHRWEDLRSHQAITYFGTHMHGCSLFHIWELELLPKSIDILQTLREHLFLLALAVLCQKRSFKHQSPFVLLTGQSPQVGVWSVTTVIYFTFSFKRFRFNNIQNSYQIHEEQTDPSLHWPYN